MGERYFATTLYMSGWDAVLFTFPRPQTRFFANYPSVVWLQGPCISFLEQILFNRELFTPSAPHHQRLNTKDHCLTKYAIQRCKTLRWTFLALYFAFFLIYHIERYKSCGVNV
jgi:hypothetical protein